MKLQKRGLGNLVGHKLAYAAIVVPLLTATFYSSHAMANDDESEFAKFMKRHNGHEFCMPPALTEAEATDVVTKYSLAHPELGDELRAPVAIRALAHAYPCGTSNEAANPDDDYSSLDVTVKLAADRIQWLLTDSPHDQRELIGSIENNAGPYAPPVYFVLAKVLYEQGRTDDALIWLNAGTLRARFDAARSTDRSAKSTVRELISQVPAGLRQLATKDPAKLKQIADMMVQWDKSIPFNYNPGWITRQGMNAIKSGSGIVDAPTQPLTVPRDQWDALAEKTRADYLRSIDDAIQSSSKAANN